MSLKRCYLNAGPETIEHEDTYCIDETRYLCKFLAKNIGNIEALTNANLMPISNCSLRFQRPIHNVTSNVKHRYNTVNFRVRKRNDQN